ncbi:MAG: M42 family peptidase, partial [Oscillospiraceae bacterium]
MPELLKTLCDLPGISGREGMVADAVEAFARKYTEDVYRDALGNVIVRKKGAVTPKKPIMIAAHMDEVGFLVNYITEKGLVKIINAGGVYGQTLAGRQLFLPRTGIKGVLGLAPTHIRKEKDEVPKLEDMYLDIGASSKEEAEQYVRLGDTVVFDTELRSFGENCIVGKAIDDRLGCTMMLELISSELPADTFFAFTVQEELGLRGAGTAAFAVRPGYAIVLDVGGGADNAGFKDADQIAVQGKGPIISFADRETFYDYELYQKVTEIADNNFIPWQTKTRLSGGTDAGKIQKTAAGARVIGISVSGRNIHTAASSVNMNDARNAQKLVKLV